MSQQAPFNVAKTRPSSADVHTPGCLRDGDSLVVTKVDRLGRSVKSLKEVIDELEQRRIGCKALPQIFDTTTSGGRLFFHVLAAIAEFDHDLIVERTQERFAAARACGRNGGRRPKMTDAKIKQARVMYDIEEYTVQEIAVTFDGTRPTIYRYLDGTSTEVSIGRAKTAHAVAQNSWGEMALISDVVMEESGD